MKIRVEKKITGNLNPTPVLQQTAFWSAVKRNLGYASKAFDIKIRASDLYIKSESQRIIADDVLILLQNIGEGYTVGYVPYGPTLKPSKGNQGVFLEELSEALRPCLPAGGKTYSCMTWNISGPFWKRR